MDRFLDNPSISEQGEFSVTENIGCNICGGRNNESVLRAPSCAGGITYYDLVRCKNCDLTFVNPRPKNIDRSIFYPENDYYAYREKATKGHGQALRERIKTYLMERMGGYVAQNSCFIKGKMVDRFVGKVMENHLIGVVPSSYVGNLLDVGCGNGEQLTWYRHHGWETMGIEPSKRGATAARSKGLHIIESSLEEAVLPDSFFDAITMVQVLEHLRDPKGSISKLYRALRPGGLIVAGVPNFLCIDRQVLGNAWLALEAPRHLYFFTPKSLRTLFGAAGFLILEVRRKTKYGVSFPQIQESCRLRSRLGSTGSIAYFLASPVLKFLAPRDYSSSFISIFATK